MSNSIQPALPGACGVVGIDVSKHDFHVCLLTDPDARALTGKFTSDAEGHDRFLRWLERVGNNEVLLLCLEETGCYGRELATALLHSPHQISIVNARLIKSFGQSLNLRTKNDHVDARLIAKYAIERRPEPWQPLSSEHQQLRDLARRRQQLTDLIIVEKNHLEACSDETIEADIEELLQTLESRRDALSQRMAELIQDDPLLKHRATLLQSIPGIAETTAMNLLAELPDLNRFQNARQLCAYAGLTPREHQSGTFKGQTRLCKQGRAGLRNLLFMPALCLMRIKTGFLKGFIDRLISKGKPKLCIVGALMRKLMAIVFAILRSDQPFDPNFQPRSHKPIAA